MRGDQGVMKRKRKRRANPDLVAVFPNFGKLHGVMVGEEKVDGQRLFLVRWTVPPDGRNDLDWKVPRDEEYVVKHCADSREALAAKFVAPTQPGKFSLLTEPPPGCRWLMPRVDVSDSETKWFLGSELCSERGWVTNERLRDVDLIGEHGYAPYLPSYPTALMLLIHAEVTSSMHNCPEKFAACNFVSHRAFQFNDSFVRKYKPGASQSGNIAAEHRAIDFALAKVRRQLQEP